MCVRVYLFFNPSELPSIYLIRYGAGRISFSILPRLDFFSIVTKKEENGKVEGQERGTHSSRRKCGGGVCRYGLLYQGTSDWFIADTCEDIRTHIYIYLTFSLHIYVRLVYIRKLCVCIDMRTDVGIKTLVLYHTYVAHIRVDISSISSSTHLIFHRSNSFNPAIVEFLLLFFHGGISFPSLHRRKQYNTLLEMIFVRALLRATLVSSAVRCYEPS